jgi:hypothetical protein
MRLFEYDRSFAYRMQLPRERLQLRTPVLLRLCSWGTPSSLLGSSLNDLNLLRGMDDLSEIYKCTLHHQNSQYKTN